MRRKCARMPLKAKGAWTFTHSFSARMYTKYLQRLLCATDKGRDDGQRMGGVVERQRAKKFGSLKNRFRVSFDKLFLKAESGLYTRQPINPETFRADVESLLCQAAVRGEVEKDTIRPFCAGLPRAEGPPAVGGGAAAAARGSPAAAGGPPYGGVKNAPPRIGIPRDASSSPVDMGDVLQPVTPEEGSPRADGPMGGVAGAGALVAPSRGGMGGVGVRTPVKLSSRREDPMGGIAGAGAQVAPSRGGMGGSAELSPLDDVVTGEAGVRTPVLASTRNEGPMGGFPSSGSKSPGKKVCRNMQLAQWFLSDCTVPWHAQAKWRKASAEDVRKAFADNDSGIMLGARIMKLGSRSQSRPTPVRPKKGPYPCPYGRTCPGQGLDYVPADVYDVEFLKDSVFSIEQSVTPKHALASEAPPALNRKESEARGEALEMSMLYRFNGTEQEWMEEAEEMEKPYTVRLSTSNELREDKRRLDVQP